MLNFINLFFRLSIERSANDDVLSAAPLGKCGKFLEGEVGSFLKKLATDFVEFVHMGLIKRQQSFLLWLRLEN